VHYTGIAGSGFRSLEEGERVSYEPTRGRKGEQAENVRTVEQRRAPAFWVSNRIPMEIKSRPARAEDMVGSAICLTICPFSPGVGS
jgi:hypothetical protein